jgi:hypothetical protein
MLFQTGFLELAGSFRGATVGFGSRRMLKCSGKLGVEGFISI